MEEKIAEHYFPDYGAGRRKVLGDKIVSALQQAGKDMENLELKDLSTIDQLHTGGHLATIELMKNSGLKPDDKILDAGCGIGGSSRLIAKEFKLKVTGIDIVDEFIVTAQILTGLTDKKNKFKDLLEFNQGTIMQLPGQDCMYDAVLSQHTLMNIQEKDLVFNEFARVLKPKAKLLLYEIVKKKDLGIKPFEFPVPWAASHDISFLITWESLLEKCQKAGFELVYYSDKTDQAEIWWATVKEITKKFSDNPRPLGPHIIFGENGKHFGRTMTSNLENNHISLVEAVLKKL